MKTDKTNFNKNGKIVKKTLCFCAEIQKWLQNKQFLASNELQLAIIDRK